MHRILTKENLSPNVTRLDVHAPRIAQIRKAGQFVIVHRAENSERIPLTIADSNPETGAIALVIQAVGKSTNELVALKPGDAINAVAGPLGHPTEMIESGHALCIGGGVGTAVVHPIAQGLSRSNAAKVVGAGDRMKGAAGDLERPNGSPGIVSLLRIREYQPGLHDQSPPRLPSVGSTLLGGYWKQTRTGR